MADEDSIDKAAQEWAERQRAFAKFVARYWADERFRESVRADPAKALERLGVGLDKDQPIKIVEVDENERLLIVPRTTRDWTLEEFVARYNTVGTAGSFGTAGTFACGTATIGSVLSMATVFTFGSATGDPDPPEDPEEPDDDEPEDTEPREPEDSGGKDVL